MTQHYSFARAGSVLSRAAVAGTNEAAEVLAREMRVHGQQALVEAGKEGSARIVVEGAGLIAREFGTKVISPRPVLGPALQMNRPRIAEIVARKLAGTLKGHRP